MPEQRPSLGGHRSNSSINETDSLSSTPSQHKSKSNQKHVVGKHNHRVPSSKGLHKHHGGSHTDLKKAGASSTNLKKNSSHVSLRRNRSTADVTPKSRPKSSGGSKRPTSVHFEIGAQIAAEAEDGWEEASSSASPALSRSASRLGSAQSSSKPSANNSQPHSPIESQHHSRPSNANSNQVPPANGRHTAADARIITERLLQRTPSYNTTKMSLATATPSQSHTPDPSSLPKTGATTPGGSSGGKDEIISRFVNGGSSATPGESSPFLHHHHQQQTGPSPPKASNDEVKRARSMGNLTRHDSSNTNTENDESESALAPRRKPSTHSYIPPQQSRTQQKLWLQRASSNIEPQAGVLHGGTTMPGYDGRAPGIRAQLEKTGLEYLVVRRYQDPVGAALKRLAQLPGNEKMRRIPNGRGPGHEDLGNGRYGLSQSLRDKNRKESSHHATNGSVTAPTTARNSFEGPGSQGTTENHHHDDNNADGEGDVSAILRSIWEKNFEMPNSA